MKDHPIEAIIAEKQMVEIDAQRKISNLSNKLETVSKTNAKKQNELRNLRVSTKTLEEKVHCLEQHIEVQAGHRKRIEELEKLKNERFEAYLDIINQTRRELQENKEKVKDAE